MLSILGYGHIINLCLVGWRLLNTLQLGDLLAEGGDP